jgi:thiamine-monophosphate kinase
MREFDFINQYLCREIKRKDVHLGIGDDCALLKVPSEQCLAVTMDTLIEGIHFPPDCTPEDIAHKAIVVNLSDLAAMGAEPSWLTLALTLPDANEEWVRRFADSLFTQAEYFGVEVVGGDTTQGPLSVTIQAHGFVPEEKAIKRSGAKPGDLIYVTGTLGDAGLGLDLIQKNKQVRHPENMEYLLRRLNRPQPRVAAGISLRSKATAAIDLSDGLAADLGHICKDSHVGAKLQLDKLPLSDEILDEIGYDEAINYALTSGDDYELCFTVPEEFVSPVEVSMAGVGVNFSQIGRIVPGSGIEYYRGDEKVDMQVQGYEHFS